MANGETGLSTPQRLNMGSSVLKYIWHFFFPCKIKNNF